jgi:sulfoxide reductase heme-binding subunit YedZ
VGSYAVDVLPARREAGSRVAVVHPAVWFFRLLLLTPFVFMAPEIIAGLRGQPNAIDHLQSSGADVLGNAGLIIFMLMLAVTPATTMTGWRWHVVLRRDYGIAMFAVAFTDLVIAAIVTNNRFPGGFMTRVSGHSFLALGTFATLLSVPLVVTANKRAQRALGKYWKPLHRLTYVVWLAILIHLLLLFGFHGLAIHALEVSAPLLVVRLPRVRQWFVAGRKARDQRVARLAIGVLLTGAFVAGLQPFVHHLVDSGTQAFVQHPVG